MQINGVRTFPLSFVYNQKTHNPNLENNNQNSKNSDTAIISDLGMRLSVRKTKKIFDINSSEKYKEVSELMSKTLSETENILEKMQSLTKKASKDDLTELDRLTMQIEMEDLREKLTEKSLEMREKFAQMSGHEKKQKLTSNKDDAFFQQMKEEHNLDTRSMLERARERLLNGEEWDVAEECEVLFFDGNRQRMYGGGWHVIDDASDAPTVHDKIKASGTIDLMSSGTAQKGIKDIENQITDMKTLRENFNSFMMSYTGDDLGQGMTVADLDEDERINAFDTILGIMRTDDEGNYPELIRPTNQLGFMFLKIDKMLNKATENLAATLLSDIEFEYLGYEETHQSPLDINFPLIIGGGTY